MLDVHEVHRAAQAPAEPVVPAHQLGHDPAQRCALRDGVAMRAVTAVHGVVRPQLPAHADRHRLLADAEVHEPVHLVARVSSPTRSSKTRMRHIERRSSRPTSPSSRAAVPSGTVYAGDGRGPSTCCTAATIFASSGRRYCSIGSL